MLTLVWGELRRRARRHAASGQPRRRRRTLLSQLDKFRPKPEDGRRDRLASRSVHIDRRCSHLLRGPGWRRSLTRPRTRRRCCCWPGDGFQDLMVCTAFGLKIYRNDGGTSLTDVTASLHLAHYPGDAQMVDMNGDGKLDVVEVLGKRPHALYAPAQGARVPRGREAGCLDALPALSVYGEHVRLAARAGRFVAEIDAALLETDPAAASRRSAFAAGHSWEERLELISRLVEQTGGAQLQPPGCSPAVSPRGA